MANQNGGVYGLTVLSPIFQNTKAERKKGEDSPALEIRKYLAQLPTDQDSPFAKVPGTHMCRLVVMDDVVFVGHPAREEHLHSQYLVFESNFDGDLDPYLERMLAQIPKYVDAIWRHCVDFPGVKDVGKFKEYMKRCQLTTTFYFADVNNKTVQQTQDALRRQQELAEFVEQNQGKAPAELQAAFIKFMRPKEYGAA